MQTIQKKSVQNIPESLNVRKIAIAFCTFMLKNFEFIQSAKILLKVCFLMLIKMSVSKLKLNGKMIFFGSGYAFNNIAKQ